MDIKLRRYNAMGKCAYGVTWLITLCIISATLVVATVFAALQEMYWINSYGLEEIQSYYGGQITDLARYNSLMDIMGMALVLGMLLTLILLVILTIITGRFTKDEKGQYHINWCDEIWAEIHIGLVIGGAVIGVIILKELYGCWLRGMYLGVWKWFNTYQELRIAEDTQFVLLIAGTALCSAVTLTSLMALVKKIKARRFWETSLIGGIVIAIYRGFKKNDKTMSKIMIVLIGGAILCATWVGLPFVVAGIILLVPKGIRKYMEIKKGVEEVKNGNLSYCIPVEQDSKGIKGELDRLASDINDISRASNIAVQNELKNQRLKTELISNVSHDLKTPLTSMISYIDLLKKEGTDSENASEYLEILDKKTQRLKVLTEDLFEAAKASSGAIPVNPEAIDLEALITQSLVEMEDRLSQKNLDIKISNKCSSTKITADGQLMWRVIENLLGNISKYALKGSRVYINMRDLETRGEERNDMVVLEIKNISEDALNISADELTERFKRGDESRNTEGSGLGLAIAKDLVKLMNGIFEINIDGDLFKVTVMMEKVK